MAAAALFLAACDGATISSGPTSTIPASPSAAPTDNPASETPEPTPSSEPSAATSEPTATASDAETPEPSPSSAASGCTGSDKNRAFFAAVAGSVSWDVYCPTLGSGWVVDSGTWFASAGGRMDIVYRTRSGARFELHEGAFCGASDGCVPDGSDAGAAAFGDRDGTLIAGTDGSWAVVVDRGQRLREMLG